MEFETVEKKEEKKSSFIKDILLFSLLAVIIVIPVRLYIAQPFIVSGASMVPTFETGQYLIVDQLSYRFHEPIRGDVVIFRYPNNPSRYFIKRVIGLPGETIEINGSEVYVTTTDGERTLLDEPYIALNRDTTQTTVLSDEEYFVMGDNRLSSLDSRSWGPLESEFITGRALLRLLPFDKVEFLPGEHDSY